MTKRPKMADVPDVVEVPASGAAGAEEKLRRRREAQRLSQEAMRLLEDGRTDEAVGLCREALGIHPDCVDARLIVADLEIDDVPGFLEALGDACDAGVRDLGEDVLERHRGKLWSLPEGRPYLRALGMLAETLREHGRKPVRREAIDVYLRLLQLDDEDHQGVRTPLASLLLSFGQPELAGRIVSLFPRDKSPLMQWLRTFARFELGDAEGAERLARDAESRNGRIMPYALGLEPMPRESTVPRGGGRPHEAEALHAADLLRLAIRSSKPLRAWLLERRGLGVGRKGAVDRRAVDPYLEGAAKLLVAMARAAGRKGDGHPPRPREDRKVSEEAERRREQEDASADDLPPIDPADRVAAQKLADEAWALAEAGEVARAVDLCRQAVARNRDCVSALHLFAEIGPGQRKDRLRMLELACSAGSRELGSRFFSENLGRFWELPETRPFMRARCSYADLLRAGRSRADREKAIEVYGHLLTLGRRDELGCRASLVSLLLSFGRVDEARAVLARYPGDRLLSVRWLEIAATFASGDREAAARLVRKAEPDNQHVLPRVLGLERTPRDATRKVVREPDSPSEAAEVAELLRPVLRPPAGSRESSADATFDALFDWLLVQFVEAAGPPRSKEQEARAIYVVLHLPSHVRIPDEVMKAFRGVASTGRSTKRAKAAAARPLWKPAQVAPPRASERTRFEAQQLAYDAMQLLGEGRRADALVRCREALAIHPDCVDAMLMAAQVEIRDPDEQVDALAEIANAGVRDLGEEFIERHAGDFWGILETRPYMRALVLLAEAMRAHGRVEIRAQAARVYEEMLRLNPNDNQGVREPLVGLLLELGETERAERRLADHPDDRMLTMEWLRAIALFARGRAGDAHGLAVEAARRNAHVLPYLIGVRRLPSRRPGEYVVAPDSPTEAMHAAGILMPIARRMPGLKDWLREIHRANRRQQTQLKLHPAPEGSKDEGEGEGED